MTIVIVMDNGSELRVKCEECKIKENELTGLITNMNFKGITENKPLYIPTDHIQMVYRVLSDEQKGEE